jgi:hypothetical protein
MNTTISRRTRLRQTLFNRKIKSAKHGQARAKRNDDTTAGRANGWHSTSIRRGNKINKRERMTKTRWPTTKKRPHTTSDDRHDRLQAKRNSFGTSIYKSFPPSSNDCLSRLNDTPISEPGAMIGNTTLRINMTKFPRDFTSNANGTSSRRKAAKTFISSATLLEGSDRGKVITNRNKLESVILNTTSNTP